MKSSAVQLFAILAREAPGLIYFGAKFKGPLKC